MKNLLFILLLTLLGCSEEPSKSTDPPPVVGEVPVVITPTPEVPNEITLYWTGPTDYTDGTPLPISAIGGYKIYYGTSSRKYDIKVDIPDNYADKYIFPKLEPNIYYIVITCYDTKGTESKYSKELTFTVE
jgi:hypothetical protein